MLPYRGDKRPNLSQLCKNAINIYPGHHMTEVAFVHYRFLIHFIVKHFIATFLDEMNAGP